MKLSQLISAKTLSLSFLAIALTSGYLAMGARDAVSAASDKLAHEEKARDQAKSVLARVSATLGSAPESAAPDYSALASTFNTKAHAAKTNNGVVIAAVVASAPNLLADAEVLPGTAVKSARLTYRGTYQSYEGLLNWIRALRANGSAIVALKVKGLEYEVAVRLYGMEQTHG